MWLHCNNCGIKKSENKNVKFFILHCFHVLCENCNMDKTCPIHNRSSTGSEINKSMPEKMKRLLEELDELLGSMQKSVRFQFEQRNLIENRECIQVKENTLKVKEEIAVLSKYKEAVLQSIEKESKCINKLEAYCANLEQKQQSEELSASCSTTGSTSSVSDVSLNVSSSLRDSGVDMDFDGFNISY